MLRSLRSRSHDVRLVFRSVAAAAAKRPPSARFALYPPTCSNLFAPAAAVTGNNGRALFRTSASVSGNDVSNILGSVSVPPGLKAQSNITPESYREMYARSVGPNAASFWCEQAQDRLTWKVRTRHILTRMNSVEGF